MQPELWPKGWRNWMPDCHCELFCGVIVKCFSRNESVAWGQVGYALAKFKRMRGPSGLQLAFPPEMLNRGYYQSLFCPSAPWSLQSKPMKLPNMPCKNGDTGGNGADIAIVFRRMKKSGG